MISSTELMAAALLPALWAAMAAWLPRRWPGLRGSLIALALVAGWILWHAAARAAAPGDLAATLRAVPAAIPAVVQRFLRPREALDWLPLAIVIAALIEAAALIRNRAIRVMAVILMTALSSGLVLRMLWTSAWLDGSRPAWPAVLAVTLPAVGLGLATAAGLSRRFLQAGVEDGLRATGWGVPVLAFVALCVAVVLVCTGSLRLAWLALIPAATLAGLCLSGRAGDGIALLPVAVMSIATLGPLWAGVWFSGTRPAEAALVGAAWIAAVLAWPARNLDRNKQTAMLALPVVLAASAVLLAIARFQFPP